MHELATQSPAAFTNGTALLSPMREGIMLIEPDGTIAGASAAACTLLGRTTAGLVGQPLSSLHESFLLPVDEQPAEHPLERMMREGQQLHRETLVYVRPANPEFSRLQELTLEITSERTPDGVVVMSMIDITHTARFIDRLLSSETQLRVAVDHAPVGIVRLNLGGLLTFVNEHVDRMLGVGSGQTHGHRWMSMVHPEDHAGVEHEWREAIERRSTLDASFRVRSGAGTWRRVMLEATPVFDEAGRLEGFAGTLRDMQPLVELRQKLVDLQTRQQLVGSASSDTLLAIQDGRIIEALGSTDVLLGRNARQLTALSDPLTLFHASDHHLFADLLDRARKDGSVQQAEMRVQNASGAYQPVNAHVISLRDAERGGERTFCLLAGAHTAVAAESRDTGHDPVTGLLTRDAFLELVDTQLGGRTNGLMAIIDLDNAGSLQEHQGSAVLERVMAELAGRLRDHATPEWVLGVAASAFLVWVPGDAADAEEQLRDLQSVLRAPCEVRAGEPVWVTSTVGLAAAGADAQAPSMLADAESARTIARRAQRRGGMQALDSETQHAVTRSRRMRDILRDTLSAEGVQLHARYEPIADLEMGLVKAVIARPHLEHLIEGSVDPDELVAEVQAVGLGHWLDMKMLEQIVAESSLWSQADLRVHLPISTQSVDDDVRLGEMVAKASALDPERLRMQLPTLPTLPAQRRWTSELLSKASIGVVLSRPEDLLTAAMEGHVDGLCAVELAPEQTGGYGNDSAITASLDAMASLGRRVDVSLCAAGIDTSNAMRTMHELGCTLGRGRLVGGQSMTSSGIRQRLEAAGSWHVRLR